MFETSVVQARPQKSRVGLLTISIVAHTAVILGAAAVSVASVEFPDVAPDEMISFAMPVVQIPPPLGRPDGGGTPPQPKKDLTPPPAPQPKEITAPPVIPDETPVADTPMPGSSSSTEPGTGKVPGPIGVEDGDPNSIDVSNVLPTTIVTPPAPEKIYEAREVNAPVLLHRVDPQYPEIMRKTKMRAKVGIRCVIDKNGRIRDPQLVMPAMPPFNDAVLNVIQHWRYKPGSLNGQAVETYLDLTVTFSIN